LPHLTQAALDKCGKIGYNIIMEPKSAYYVTENEYSEYNLNNNKNMPQGRRKIWQSTDREE
jgi:hypothetical protein